MNEKIIELNEGESARLWDRILADAENLPALPDIVNKVLEQIENPNSNPKDFEEVISKDPVLTAKVLKMSNSAYYGYSREIVTLSEAVIILGLETLKSLVIAASAFKSLNKTAEGYGLGRGDLWRHSLATAMGARLIAKKEDKQESEKYFVAGLLHDIGKILLSQYIGKYIESIKHLAKMRSISFEQAEKEVLGFNHCDVGAELTNFWKLPQLFYEVSKFHHTPFSCNSEYSKFVKIIHIADIISYKIKIGTGADSSYYYPIQKIFEDFKINKKRIDEIMSKIHSSVREFERILIK